jgi:restriction system protein
MATLAIPHLWPLWLLVALVFGVGVVLRLAVQAGRREVDAEQRRLDELARAARDQDLKSLDGVGGTAFELYIAGLCVRDGFAVARAGGGAGDLGADVIATAPDGRLVVIQCKRYKPGNAVPGPDMQRFLGTVRSVHRADIPVFVTTAWRFTKQSQELAASHGVVLIHRDLLGHWNNGMSLERFLPAAQVGRGR